MTKTTRRNRKGFTLIELLTVIAIIGILASIIIPTVSKVQQTAKRTADASNLRQIGQASLIFAQSSKDQLPALKIDSVTFSNSATGTNVSSVKTVAAALAIGGGLESGKMWVSRADDTTTLEGINANVGNVLATGSSGVKTIDTNFNEANLAFGYVVGLSTNSPSTTPVAYTRGIGASGTTGKWNLETGTYKDDGGHIVFVGGNVQFYKNLGTTTAGELINASGAQTNSITATVRANKNASVQFIEENNAKVAASNPPTGPNS